VTKLIVFAVALCALAVPSVASAQIGPPPVKPPIGDDGPPITGGGANPPPVAPSQPPSGGSPQIPASPGPPASVPTVPPVASLPEPSKAGSVKLHGRILRVSVGCPADGKVVVRYGGKRRGAAKFVCASAKGVARVKLSRKVARKIRQAGSARVRISVLSGGKTTTEVVRLRHGSFGASVAATAAGVNYFTEWFHKPLGRRGPLRRGVGGLLDVEHERLAPTGRSLPGRTAWRSTAVSW
jgi:hypothetical protein